MKYPNFQEEKKYWRKRYKLVTGLDEAGRGPLAGPVVAAAVTLKKTGGKPLFSFKIRDSKKLSPKKREKFYKILTKHPNIEWGIGRTSERIIDKINILEATKLAMKKALKVLEKKVKNQKPHNFYDRRKYSIIDFLILDGKMKLDLEISQKSIVKADEKVFSCAAASIIAKVTRDRMMKKYHQKYPQYRFDRHKGYCTKYHLKMLKKYGPCKIHRKSFNPVLKILKTKNKKT